METKDILEHIFKDPKTQYELTEFEHLGKPIHQIISIYPKVITFGKEAGKTKYFLKSFVTFPSGKGEAQVYSEDGKSAPEEIIRQLWIYKLINQYDYREDEIELEKSVYFGTEVIAKAADIVVYTNNTKQTPKIIIETKKPKRKDGIEQLKSYLNAEGSPVGVWSNGSDSVILYRPYPREFDDTLFDIPKRGQEPRDVLEASKTLPQLRRDFNFKKIIQDIEELVLADSGVDEFNEIFKLIFAKIWDEKEATENRRDKVVQFRKAIDPQITYDRINGLFHRACEEWPGIFRDGDNIELRKDHLQVCVGPIEGVRLLGSNLRIMDDAFEYLLPTEAKKKKGQFFTPRHVVEMCVRMLNPKRNEYVMDPACGSGGFLLHAMEWCYPAHDPDERELRKHRYAAKYLWGIDFELRAAKTSRALMLIAGDGHTNIFGPDVSSLDPKTWYETSSGQSLMQGLRTARLTANRIPDSETLHDEDKAWEYFDELKFDVVLANPPFAGEMKDKKMLAHYELARPALKRAKNKGAKEERDVLFIERIIKMLKPGGRAAIVLPQGKFNNSSLGFIRDWILHKARLLAVVGLHPNTFKPHTGTKTSVLFVQKYTPEQLEQIDRVKQEVAAACPDYESEIKVMLDRFKDEIDIPDDDIPDNITDLMAEAFPQPEQEADIAEEELDSEEEASAETVVREVTEDEPEELDSMLEQAQDKLDVLKKDLLMVKVGLSDLDSEVEALREKQNQEIAVVTEAWKDTKKALASHLRPLKAEHKAAITVLTAEHKDRKKRLQMQIRALEKAIVNAEVELKMLTNKGKLELIMADPELIGTLKDRWMDAGVAKRLDYLIFMAVSEHGGKNNSGEYEYMIDGEGNRVEFSDGHPQAGHPKVDQDLVNYDLGADDLADIEELPDDELCIAEAFIRFARENRFTFWEVN